MLFLIFFIVVFHLGEGFELFIYVSRFILKIIDFLVLFFFFTAYGSSMFY